MLASENDVQKIDAPEDAFAMCSAASLSTCRASRCGERGLNDSRLQCRGSGISREDKTDARFSRRLIWLRLGTSGRIAPTVGWFALHPMATVWRACASPRPAAAPSRVSTREHSRRRAPRRLATRAAAAEARPSHLDGRRLGRRDASALLASIAASAPGVPPALAALNEPVVTHRVYFDVGLCPSIVRADRALGSKGGLCEDPEDLGRVVIGLYGELVPNVVERFLALVNAPPGEGYAGTVFHRIKPGAYVLAGQAGSYRMGQVQARRSPPNPELLDGASFRERHLRPGTVSLALGAATGDGDAVGAERSSAQTEFLITTGPAPVPSLDGENVVFGRVLSGLETVTRVAATPTFKPSSNSVAWNQVAEWVGDDRAAKARQSWSKPTQAIVITRTGEMS